MSIPIKVAFDVDISSFGIGLKDQFFSWWLYDFLYQALPHLVEGQSNLQDNSYTFKSN